MVMGDAEEKYLSIETNMVAVSDKIDTVYKKFGGMDFNIKYIRSGQLQWRHESFEERYGTEWEMWKLGREQCKYGSVQGPSDNSMANDRIDLALPNTTLNGMSPYMTLNRGSEIGGQRSD